jgi:cytosine/adenosine deaminase-related metal-dependent hydrolase
MAVYLRDAILLDWLTLGLTTGHLRVAAGEGPEPVESVPHDLAAGDEVIDCGGRLVTRSFACGHHHAYSALALGMPPPAAAPVTFGEILERVWWRLDRSLDSGMIEASALATAVDAVRCGVTFVIDHHSSPNAIEGSLETLRAAFDRVGITCLPCYEMSDRDGPRAREEGLAETQAYLESGRQGLVGLHASFTVGEELLRRAVELADASSTGVHMHVAEDPLDRADTRARYGCGVVERLNDAGVLASGRTILAHCLDLQDSERALIARSPAWVAQNTESNFNNAVGAPRTAGLGERILLGTDGLHTDMLRAAQFTWLAAQLSDRPTPAVIYRRLRAVHLYLEANGFEGDGEDNLVVLDYPTRTEITEENFLSHFIYGLRSSHVDSVIARGRVVMRHRTIVTVDEREVNARARAEARRLWEALKRGT